LAGALAWFWHNKGHLSEGNLWLEKILASGIANQGKERAKALRASSILSTGTGDYIRARAFAESSIKLYREIGDNQGAGLVLADLGASLHWDGKEEEAIAWLRRSIETNRNYPMSHFFLAAALARLGLLPEACSEVRTGLAINPTFSIHRFRASTPSDNPTAVAGRERIIDGLRKAGVSEA
jgi:tetratricopeptide (TPR) repeat protein